MSLNLVRINTASPDELAKLHGVGAKLANRIYRYRESNGFFQRPEDLTKIKGINLEFAILLGTQIDWNLPIKASQVKEPDLLMALFFFFYAVGMGYGFFQYHYLWLSKRLKPFKKVLMGHGHGF